MNTIAETKPKATQTAQEQSAQEPETLSPAEASFLEAAQKLALDEQLSMMDAWLRARGLYPDLWAAMIAETKPN